MNILVTRPERDALQTAARLAELGHKAVIAPVTEIVVTGAKIPIASYSAVLVTSANALRALPRRDIEQLQNVALHCVGQKTADVARSLGFSRVHVSGGSGHFLVEDIIGAYSAGAALLYLTGTPRKPMVEQGLRASGFAVTSYELYRAQTVSDWPGRARAMIPQIDVALHYSRASVEALLDLSEKAGMLADLHPMRHICLSPDVAAPLLIGPVKHIAIAVRPSEASMLDLL